MSFSFNSIHVINIILCFIINIIGYWIYKKNKNIELLKISLAFGLFGLNHIMSLLGISNDIKFIYLLIRFSAYALLISLFIKFIPKKIYFFLLPLLSYIPYLMPKGTKIFSITLNNLEGINLILCILISAFSIIEYFRRKNKLFLFIFMSFFLFAISRFIEIFYATHYNPTLLSILRIIAYLIITYFITVYEPKRTNIMDYIIGYITNSKMQILSIVGMISIIGILFYFPIKKILISDPISKLDNIPVKVNGKKLNIVRTGMHIDEFSTFDIVNNKFVMDAIVWFKFNPYTTSLQDIEAFTFKKGKFLKKEKINSRIKDDKLWVYYKVKVAFSTNLNYKYFPIEDHKVDIVLTNKNLNLSDTIFVSYNSDLTIKDTLFTTDWQNIDKAVEFGSSKDNVKGYQERMFNSKPTVSFKIFFAQKGISKILTIFIPLFMVFFLSLLSLVTTIKDTGNYVGMSVGSTSALMFYLVAMQRVSPRISYFTIANKIYMLLLILAFIILLINIFIAKKVVATKTLNRKNFDELILVRSYTYYFFSIFILLMIYSILY